MSAWRKEASKRLPEFQRIIASRDVENPMSTTSKPSSAVIVGLGRTGLSCARYLHALGWKIAVTDTRAQPPELAALRQLDSRIPVSTGGLDVKLLDDALCVEERPNLPGTTTERPNWSIALPLPIDDLAEQPVVAQVAGALSNRCD